MTSVFHLTEADRASVVEAYRRASASGKSTPDCYLAAVDVLHRLYPDARRALVATEAVRIITSDVNFIEFARSLR